MSKKSAHHAGLDLEKVSRRKVIKTLVGGVTTVAALNFLPAKWDSPLVESIFLPAHAQTSGGVAPAGQYAGAAILVGAVATEHEHQTLLAEIADKIGDFLVPEANASSAGGFSFPLDVCMSFEDNNVSMAAVFDAFGSTCFDGSGTLDDNVAEITLASVLFKITVLETTASAIKVVLNYTICSTLLEDTVWLPKSSEPCMCLGGE